MFGFAWSTFRDRWPLFIGAILMTAFAIAFTQSSLLALVSAATADVPPGASEPERLALQNGYATAITLLSLITGIAFFVSIFVVASTFSFAVAQRRRDFALLRLIGASRRQVRRLLLREAFLLGALAILVSIPLGVGVSALQDEVLARLGFVPEGFRTEWHSWVIGVSVVVGIVVANLAARVAARRASRVPPLESLRGSIGTDQVMTGSRWVIGALGIAGAIAMVSVAPLVGPDAAVALAINICVALVIALTAWSPIVVPSIAALIALVAGAGGRDPLAELVGGNLRASVRRTAATAAPATVLCGLVVGVSGTFGVLTEAIRQETRATNISTVVATSDRPIGPVLRDAAGIDCLSEEVDVVAHVRAADFGDEPLADTSVAALAIDPAAYLCTHRIEASRGDLARLTGTTIAVDSDLAGRMRVDLGDTTQVAIGGRQHIVKVVAITPTTFNALPELWLPIGLLHDTATTAIGSHHVSLQTADATSTDAALELLASTGVRAWPTSDWIDQHLTENARQNRNLQIALVGLATLFTLVAIANAVINAAAARRGEFATLQLVGLTRGQVIRVALWESTAILVTSTVLGILAALGPILAMSRTASRILGTTVFAWPWQALALVTLTSAALIALTTVLATLAATSASPATVRAPVAG